LSILHEFLVKDYVDQSFMRRNQI